MLQPRYPGRDRATIETFATIGNQIAQFTERKRTEEALRDSEQKSVCYSSGCLCDRRQIPKERLFREQRSAANFWYERGNRGQIADLLMPECIGCHQSGMERMPRQARLISLVKQLSSGVEKRRRRFPRNYR